MSADLFQDCIDYLERMTEHEREEYFADTIKSLSHPSKGPLKPYYKVPYGENNDTCVIMIFWAPDGRTRPHSHGGSSARVRVVRWALAQDKYEIGESPPAKWLGRTVHSTHKDWDIIEEPGGVHRICNCSIVDWSVSVHEFYLDFSMEIYDFESNLHWPVEGEEDTLGKLSENAVPIWV